MSIDTGQELMMLSVQGLRRLGLHASFELDAGECIAIRGPSGSGKSVVLRAIADLDPNEGVVKLEGVLRESMAAPLWRRLVTYVAAEPGWWADTVREHFANWDEASRLVQRVGLPVSCAAWPIARLSTGERQRLGLVRALVLDSRVLLLDEPTSALDQEATAAVEAIIAERGSTGTGVIWVTHDMAQSRRVASRLLVVDRGRIGEHAL